MTSSIKLQVLLGYLSSVGTLLKHNTNTDITLDHVWFERLQNHIGELKDILSKSDDCEEWESAAKDALSLNLSTKAVTVPEEKHSRMSRAELFEKLEQETCDLRCIEDGEDSYHWEVISHFMQAPNERTLGYGLYAEDALRDAFENTDSAR